MIQAPTVSTLNRAKPLNIQHSETMIQQHLQNLESQLNQLRAQVRQVQQLSSLGVAAATIAHEVNNLLTPIRGYAQAALASGDQELARKALTKTVEHVDMIVAMSERVLEIGASTEPRFEQASVRSIVERAIESLCRDLSKDGLSLSIEIDDALDAWVDPLQIRQVLFNLFLNAKKAMASAHNGKLTIRARREHDRVMIEVADNGPGIDSAILPHVFDALISSKPTDSPGPKRCSGLGLKLCRDLVEENGGTISVESTLGTGTTFLIDLPGQSNA